jgi:hypothetical protein
MDGTKRPKGIVLETKNLVGNRKGFELTSAIPRFAKFNGVEYIFTGNLLPAEVGEVFWFEFENGLREVVTNAPGPLTPVPIYVPRYFKTNDGMVEFKEFRPPKTGDLYLGRRPPGRIPRTACLDHPASRAIYTLIDKPSANKTHNGTPYRWSERRPPKVGERYWSPTQKRLILASYDSTIDADIYVETLPVQSSELISLANQMKTLAKTPVLVGDHRLSVGTKKDSSPDPPQVETITFTIPQIKHLLKILEDNHLVRTAMNEPDVALEELQLVVELRNALEER